MADAVQFLSDISGVPRKEVSAIWVEVQENQRKLNSCKKHRFEGGAAKMGQKFGCLECGGTLGLTDIGYYVKGYVAHGGNVNDIWPGFERRHEK